MILKNLGGKSLRLWCANIKSEGRWRRTEARCPWKDYRARGWGLTSVYQPHLQLVVVVAPTKTEAARRQKNSEHLDKPLEVPATIEQLAKTCPP